MRNSKVTLSLTVIAASLMAVHGAARAEEDAELNKLIRPTSKASVGVGAWNHERPQFGIYDGMRENDVYLLFDADIRMREEATATWKNLTVRNLGLDNRDIRGEYYRQGDFGAEIEYDRTQRNEPFTINTNHLGIGTNLQTTGANIANTAIGSGAEHHFGTDREKFGLGFYKNLMPHLDFRIKLSTEDKQGERITSNGSSLFVADLIDWTSQQLDASLSYTGDRLQLSGGYLGSLFKNNNDAGYVSLAGAPATLVTQPLDNQAHQVGLSGGYSFLPSTRGTFKVEYTHATQDETLPTSQISSNSFALIPSLNGEVNTTLAQVGLSSKPVSRLSLLASLRYYDVEDNTPQFTTIARTDGGGTIDVNSTPYSYRTTTGKVEGTYDLRHGYSTTAGIDYSDQDRTVHTMMGASVYNPYVPLRAQLDETTYRLQLRKSLSDTLTGSIGYSFADRNGSDFELSSREGTLFVSPVHTADRERQKIRLAFDWTPVERLGIQAGFETAADRYGDNARSHGLNRGDVDVYTLDAGYQVTKDCQLSVWYAYNTNEAHFLNRDTATNTFIKEQNDTGEAFGVSLNSRITDRIKAGMEISWASDRSVFEQANSDGTLVTAIAPDISSKSTRVKLFTNLACGKFSEVRLDLGYEQWKSNEWQWFFQDGKPWQFGTATDGTTVIAEPRQDATFAAVRYIYKFQ